MNTTNKSRRQNQKLYAHYLTDCGVSFTLVREFGERLETTEDIQLKDGKMARGWMTGVEAK